MYYLNSVVVKEIGSDINKMEKGNDQWVTL